MSHPTQLTADDRAQRAASAGLYPSVADCAGTAVRPAARSLPVDPKGADAQHVGPYRLLRELGTGARGAVYLAEDTLRGRRVALKVLTPNDTMAQAQHAAQLLTRIDHPGIATIYETHRDNGRAWIAMRHVAGGSAQQLLADRLASGLGPPRTGKELSSVVRLVKRAARGLAAAHAKGILHGGIKPANLLLSTPDTPALVDFGQAGATHTHRPKTTAHVVDDDPLAYTSPERQAGAAADARADVYSLGAVLFELLTLKTPAAAVAASGRDEVCHAGIADVARCNPALPGDLRFVVAAAIASSPRDRYRSASAFADDLGRVLAFQPIVARPASRNLRLHRWAHQHRRLAQSLMAFGTALLVGLTMTIWLWRRIVAALDAPMHRANPRLARHPDALSAAPTPIRAGRPTGWRDRLPAHRRLLAELPAGGDDAAVAWRPEPSPAPSTKNAPLARPGTVGGRRPTTLIGGSPAPPGRAYTAARTTSQQAEG